MLIKVNVAFNETSSKLNDEMLKRDIKIQKLCKRTADEISPLSSITEMNYLCANLPTV